MRRIVTLLAAGFIAIAAGVGFASQNPLFSPSTGTVSGLALTNNFNSAIDSLNTCNSGIAAPTNQLSGVASLGNCWIDTSVSPNPVKRHDGNGHWLITGWIDPTNGILIPVTGGGTATVSSATTTDIGASPQTLITISGTTTITSFGSSAPQLGLKKTLTFSNVLILTYNATSLILPGAASITTQVNDVAEAIYLGGGNWRVLSYNRADGTSVVNPAVPVGTVIAYSGFTAPTSYDFAAGQTYSRASFPQLLTALTSTVSVTRTSGSPTLSGFTDTTHYGAGQPIEGTGIPGGATISSCAPTTCTMSTNASTSGTANVQIFPHGNGNGSTTFTLPDLKGRTIAGLDNMLGTAANRVTVAGGNFNAAILGAAGGAQNVTLARANLPNVTLTVTGTTQPKASGVPIISPTSGATATGFGAGALPTYGQGTFAVADNTALDNGATASINGGVTQTVVSEMPPAMAMHLIIRVSP